MLQLRQSLPRLDVVPLRLHVAPDISGDISRLRDPEPARRGQGDAPAVREPREKLWTCVEHARVAGATRDLGIHTIFGSRNRPPRHEPVLGGDQPELGQMSSQGVIICMRRRTRRSRAEKRLPQLGPLRSLRGASSAAAVPRRSPLRQPRHSSVGSRRASHTMAE